MSDPSTLALEVHIGIDCVSGVLQDIGNISIKRATFMRLTIFIGDLVFLVREPPDTAMSMRENFHDRRMRARIVSVHIKISTFNYNI